MTSAQLLDKLLDSEVLVPVLITFGIVGTIVIRSLAGVLRTFAREKTRREIAAFIAEGSMSPEQGERLMKAGDRPESC